MRLIDADKLLEDFEWLNEYDHLISEAVKKSIDIAQSIEAIPVEWLLKRAEMCTSDYSNCLHYAVEDWLNEQKYMVDGRWKFLGKEKENESNI